MLTDNEDDVQQSCAVLGFEDCEDVEHRTERERDNDMEMMMMIDMTSMLMDDFCLPCDNSINVVSTQKQS